MTRAAAIREASKPLFEELALKPGDRFPLKSSRYDENGITYEMVVTPEGFVVHDGEGCEGEHFGGVRSCQHSKKTEKYVSNSIVPYEAMVPQRIEFSDTQLETIAKVICVDTEGRVAPPAFVQLFVAACRHTGLDPFLRQIYALSIRGKWTMFVGIDGYRVISERTGLDQGMDGPEWSDDGQNWYDFPFSDSPAFCRVGIWRKDVPRPFTAVCSMKAKINPNSDSWKKDAPGMLAKCAEALARRRAFPADMAVIPQDASFDTEDAPNWRVSEEPRQSLASRTGHEVYNGQLVDRETGEVIEHEMPKGSKFSPNALAVEHEDTQEAAVSASDGAPSGAPDVTEPVEEAGTTPPAPSPTRQPSGSATAQNLLNEISKKYGAAAATAAKAILPIHFDTMDLGKLDSDQRADYCEFLRVRLDDPNHEHDGRYTASARYVCGHCGCELEEEPTTDAEAAQAGLPV